MSLKLTYILVASIVVLGSCQYTIQPIYDHSSTQLGPGHPSTQPSDSQSATAGLTFTTDSLVFHRYAGAAAVQSHIHNGTDSTVVFPACGFVSVRADLLQDTSWIYGRPGWMDACIASEAWYVVLAADSSCGTLEYIRTPGTYRMATIHRPSYEFKTYRDTLYSNTFEVR